MKYILKFKRVSKPKYERWMNDVHTAYVISYNIDGRGSQLVYLESDLKDRSRFIELSFDDRHEDWFEFNDEFSLINDTTDELRNLLLTNKEKRKTK